MSTNFAMGLDMVCDLLDFLIHVYTPIEDSVCFDKVYHSCFIMFIGCQTWADLMISDMVDLIYFGYELVVSVSCYIRLSR